MSQNDGRDNLFYKKDSADVDPIEYEELDDVLNSFKSRKSPGYDGINIELLKYASPEVKYRFLNILHICWYTGKCWMNGH
jgi:hypothetical protein